MTACPKCGSSVPDARGVAGDYAPVWALCRACGWPLDRDAMIERLLASRADVKSVLIVVDGDLEPRTLDNGDVQSAVDGLAGQVEVVLPVCEAAGMLAFRRMERVEFFLFDGESVQRALAAMAGI